MEIRDIARPFLENLSNSCDKTVNLSILDDYEVVYIDRIKVHNINDFSISIGTRLPVYNTAAGKAIVAYLSEKDLVDVLGHLKSDPLFKQLYKNEASFKKELAKVKKYGFAVNEEELRKGILAIAVPVHSATGVSCSINIVSPNYSGAMQEMKEKDLPKLKQTSHLMSELLVVDV